MLCDALSSLNYCILSFCYSSSIIFYYCIDSMAFDHRTRANICCNDLCIVQKRNPSSWIFIPNPNHFGVIINPLGNKGPRMEMRQMIELDGVAW